MLDVGTLHERHPAWQVRAVSEGGQPAVWSARPWNSSGPWVIETDSAEALDKLLAEIG
jgi:hypothetical protein